MHKVRIGETYTPCVRILNLKSSHQSQFLKFTSTDNKFVEEFLAIPHSSECLREVEQLWTKALEKYRIERAVRMAIDLQRRERTMLQRLAPPVSQNPSEEIRDELYERVLEEARKEARCLEKRTAIG